MRIGVSMSGPKHLIEADRHLGQQRRLLVQEARQGHPGDAKRSGRIGDGQALVLQLGFIAGSSTPMALSCALLVASSPA